MRPERPFQPRLVAQAAPGLPVARYVAGKQADEVLHLLPRLFNLCRAAQGAAVAAALGRAFDENGIAQEVLRDHLVKFHVSWPGFFGRAPSALPGDWAKGGAPLLTALFGAAATAPATPADFDAFLESGATLAAPLRLIRDCFAPFTAVAEGLPLVDETSIWTGAPAENSVAARHLDHPVLTYLELSYGCGPLWRAAARLYDIEAAATGALPTVISGTGWAIAPAARGAYGIRIETERGLVTGLQRVTPTDALLAAGGILDRALASLPADRAGMGPLLLDILDPCSPVRLREVDDA